MPGGRPKKAGTEEERAEARRERVRLNVWAHRQRKRMQALAEQTPSHLRQDQGPDYPLFPQQNLTAVDIANHSESAPIELYFGLLPAIVSELYAGLGKYPWPMAMEQLRSKDRIVDIAVLAAGARWLGRMKSDEGMIKLSRLSYNRALQILQSHLNSFDVREVLTLNTVSNALMLFETLDGTITTKGARWRTHVSGGAALMETAGPLFYTSELGLAILRGFRHTITLSSSFVRQASFLDSDEWRTIPYMSTSLTERDELWQLAERVPSLLQRTDALKLEAHAFAPGTNPFFAYTANTLWSDMIDLRRDFVIWFSTFTISQGTTCPLIYNQPASPWFVGETLYGVFPEGYHFPNLMIADMVVNYWCSLLQLLVAYRDVQCMLEHSSAFPSPLPSPSLHPNSFPVLLSADTISEEDVALVADNICRSMEYVFGFDELDIRGILFCGLLPLWAAMQYYAGFPSRYERELQWCASVGAIVSRRGLQGPAYLFSGEAMCGDPHVPWRHLLGRAIEMPEI